jgi:nucleotide-binding universal stress UspA family protein
MLPVKRILCPTDFSEPSYAALKAAAELAGHFNAELDVVHVVGAVPLVPTTPAGAPVAFDVEGYRRELEQNSRKRLEKSIEPMIPEGVRYRPFVLHGEAADRIVDLARDEGADMIVISTHGSTGIKRIFFGSVAEKVVRHAACPVLTIRVE